MSKFYATYDSTDSEVVVFNNRADRDNWINHKDWFSETVAKGDEIFLNEKRIALSAIEAYAIVGCKLYDRTRHIKDNFLDNVMLCRAE